MRHAYRMSFFVIGVGFAALSVVAPSAQAQMAASPLSFGITAGASKAVGSGSDGVSLGYHAGALVQWNGPDLPIGIRADAVYHRFSFDNSDGNESITAVTLNGVYMFSMGAGAQVSPYLIAGPGFYHISASCSSCQGVSFSENKFGVNGGGGLMFPLSGFSAFVEARYHRIFTDGGSTSMVPVSFGVVFH